MSASQRGMRKLFGLLLLPALMLPLLATACSQHRDVSFSEPPPRYIVPPQRAAAPPQTGDGSLWIDGSRVGQVYDYRARDVNDLVTIKVVESTSAINTADITTERDDNASRGLTSLLGLQDRLLPRSVDNSSAINASTDDEYESTGTNRRTESLASTITARVIQRLPNGNLVIEGAREVIINHERQTMILRGIVRPVDIDERNSVLSTQVSDLQIRFSGSGVLTENLRRGWFSRLINYIWPL